MFPQALVGIHLLIGRKSDSVVTGAIMASKEDEAEGVHNCNGQKIYRIQHLQILTLSQVHKEANHWIQPDSAIEFDSKVAIPGLSRGYGEVYHTSDGSVCLLIAGVACISPSKEIPLLVTNTNDNLSGKRRTIGLCAYFLRCL